MMITRLTRWNAAYDRMPDMRRFIVFMAMILGATAVPLVACLALGIGTWLVSLIQATVLLTLMAGRLAPRLARR